MLAVVPVLPTLPSLLAMLPVLLLSLLSALAALRHPRVAWEVLRLLWKQKLALLILTATLGAATWAAFRMVQRVEPPRSLPFGADWAVHRGSLRRLGRPPETVGPRAAGLLWQVGRAGELFLSSPAISGDRLYAVGSHGRSARIYCLDVTSGVRRWSLAPPGYRATFSSPTIAQGRLVCGEGLHDTKTARVVCIDLEAGREGQLLWTFPTHSHVECSPVIDNGRVYFGAGDDGVYCVDLEPESDGKPRLIWHQPGSRFPDAETSLAVMGSRVFVGLGVGGQALCVLDAGSGAELKRLPMSYPVFSPPSIHDGKLYLGMGVGDYVTPHDQPAGQVCCIDLAGLHVDWKFDLKGTVLGCVAIAEEQLIFGCSDGHVYALDMQGQMLRRFNTWAPIVGSPAVDARRIYVLNQAGLLIAVDRATWEPVWEHSFQTPGRYVSSPVIADGRLMVGTEDQGLVCLGSGEAPPPERLWPGRLGGAGRSGHRDDVRLPPKPEVLWTYPSSPGAAHRVQAPVALAGQRVIVPVAAGPRRGIACLDSGERRGQAVSESWSLAADQGVWHSPAVAGGRVFFIEGPPHGGSRRLRAVELSSGKACWKRPLAPEASGWMTADSRGLLLQDGAGQLRALSLHGDTQWTMKSSAIEQPVAVTASMVVACSDRPATLWALDRLTGRKLWQTALTAPAGTSPALASGRIVMGVADALEIRSLLDGSLMARAPLAAGASAMGPHIAGQRFTCVTLDGRVVWGRLGDGVVSGVLEGADPDCNALVAATQILFASGNRLLRATSLEHHDEPTPWFDLSVLGRRTSPLVQGSGRLYVGIEGKGLICLGGGPGQ